MAGVAVEAAGFAVDVDVAVDGAGVDVNSRWAAEVPAILDSITDLEGAQLIKK